ncbi:MAG: hypothetical protein Q9228_002195 [Teloschistes exilis]
MDGFQRNHTPLAGIYGGMTQSSLPETLGCHPYDSGISCRTSTDHVAQIIEINALRSRVSTLELLLSQRQKELWKTQHVNQYLLNLNAQAALDVSSHNAFRPGIGRRREEDATVQGDIEGLLKTIVDRLEKVPDARTPTHRRASPPNAHFVCGDLLGSFEEGPVPRVQDTQSNVRVKSLLPDQMASPFDESKSVNANSHPGDRNVKDIAELNSSDHGLPRVQGSDSAMRGPYIRRFAHAQHQRMSEVHRKQGFDPEETVQNHSGDTQSSASSLDESPSNLSGPTHCNSPELRSTGVTSMPFTGSDVDDSSSGLASKRKEIKENDIVWKSIGLPVAPANSSQEHDGVSSEVSAEESSTASAKGAQVSPSPGATLFLPSWPMKPSIVSPHERERAIKIHKREASSQEHQFPDLFRYGVRFRPAPEESDMYRTVIVDDLPSKLSISSLLEHVRGGAVVEAQLHNTATISGHSSAMIIFVHEHGARSFESRARQLPLRFAGVEARVTLLPTPTWPMSPNLRTAIMNHGHTRCLEIRGMPSGISPSDLKQDMRMCHVLAPNTRHITSMVKRPDGVVEVQFTSISYAGRALGLLGNCRRYRQCQITRSMDPCSRPWEDLPEEASEADGQGPGVEKVNPTSGSNAPISWREVPFEEFTRVSEPKPQTCENAIVDERQGRLHTVELEDSPEIPRGRGFRRSENSIMDQDNTCSQQ